MAQSADILKELEGVSPAVAAIQMADTYRVPQGYFDHLPVLILDRVKAEKQDVEVDFGGKVNPYSVPAGYFENLPANLLQCVKAGDVSVYLPVEAKTNPYTIPEGYFEQLPGQVLQRLQTDEISLSFEAKSNAYTVPQGYFDSLPANVLNRVKEGGELTSYAFGKKEGPYVVPAGYFDSLAGNVLNRIKATSAGTAKEELSILSSVLGGLDKKMPFAAPAGYFNELPENVIAGAQAIEFVNGELENLSPIMAGLKYLNVYEAPEGYFENLSANVLKLVKQQPAGGKVISVSFGKRMLRYAAAAAVIGIVAVAGWLFVKPTTPGNTDSLSKAEKELQEKLKNFDNENEIVNYVENTAAVAEMNSTNTVDIKGEDIKDMLADVSDEELQQYLEVQTGKKESIN